MRILSAHYAWNGEKGFVKNPLLYLNGNHEVVKLIEQGNDYREQANTEFFSGLLIPGLLNFLDLDESISEKQFDKKLNELYSEGSVFVFIENVYYEKFNAGDRSKPKVFSLKRNKNHMTKIDHSSWIQMKAKVFGNIENDIEKLLYEYLLFPFKSYEINHIGGSFHVGKKPGVLLINGINWHDMTFNLNMTLKILDTPE